jgi:hypothetical protein
MNAERKCRARDKPHGEGVTAAVATTTQARIAFEAAHRSPAKIVPAWPGMRGGHRGVDATTESDNLRPPAFSPTSNHDPVSSRPIGAKESPPRHQAINKICTVDGTVRLRNSTRGEDPWRSWRTQLPEARPFCTRPAHRPDLIAVGLAYRVGFFPSRVRAAARSPAALYRQALTPARAPR